MDGSQNVVKCRQCMTIITPFIPLSLPQSLQCAHLHGVPYSESNKLLIIVHSTGTSAALESKISDGLEQLEQDTYRLQTMVRKEPPSRRRESQQ